MRILIDLPETTVEKLTSISARRRLPRAAVVREALDQFVRAQEIDDADSAFGSWKRATNGTVTDGLVLQRAMRDEW
jgi:predicted transcriptional regulator